MIGYFLRDIRKIQILSHQEAVAERKKMLAGDLEARDRLIHSVLPLVVKLASKFRGDRGEFGDLVQYGALHLCKRLHQWNPRRGKLTTFVSKVVFRALKLYVATEGTRGTRVAETIYKRLRLADRIGMDTVLESLPSAATRQTLKLAQATRKFASLEDSGVSRAGSSEGPVATAERQEVILICRRFMRELSAQELAILSGRLAFHGEKTSLREMGNREGVTYECIRQKYTAILKRLRRRLERAGFSEDDLI